MGGDKAQTCMHIVPVFVMHNIFNPLLFRLDQSSSSW